MPLHPNSGAALHGPSKHGSTELTGTWKFPFRTEDILWQKSTVGAALE